MIRLGKEHAGMSNALSMQKKSGVQPQRNRERIATTENQGPKAKKARCYICERSIDQKCNQACSTCNMIVCQDHSQVIWIQCNH